MQESQEREENRKNNQGEKEVEDICKLCGFSDQPLTRGYTPKKPKRTRKPSSKAIANKEKENWIECCTCDKWFHIGCVGLTKAEKRKLKGTAFFKCIVCCFKLAKSFKNSLESALDIHIGRTQIGCNESNVAEITPEKGKLRKALFGERPEQKELHNTEIIRGTTISDQKFELSKTKATETENLRKERSQTNPERVISSIDSCLAKIFQDCEDINKNLKESRNSEVFKTERIECADQNTVKSKPRVNNISAISSGDKVTEPEDIDIDCEDISRNSKDKKEKESSERKTLVTKEKKEVELEHSSKEKSISNTKPQKNKPTLLPQKLRVVEVEKVESEECAREKIIVIDGIANPDLYKNSKAILKEFNSFCPKINTTSAFSLARGGVTIYFQSKSDRDKALQKLPVESFGGGFKRSLNPKKTQTLYLRGIDTRIQIDDLLCTVKEISSEVYLINRLKSRFTGKPRQLVKLKCSEEAAKKILAAVIFVKGTQIQIEKQRNPQIIRCYSCQTYGHIAKNCRKEAVCENCSQQACESPCPNPPRCANCNNSHPAFDTDCPVYVKKYEDLAEQHTISEHVKPPTKPSCSEASTSSCSPSRSMVPK